MCNDYNDNDSFFSKLISKFIVSFEEITLLSNYHKLLHENISLNFNYNVIFNVFNIV